MRGHCRLPEPAIPSRCNRRSQLGSCPSRATELTGLRAALAVDGLPRATRQRPRSRCQPTRPGTRRGSCSPSASIFGSLCRPHASVRGSCSQRSSRDYGAATLGRFFSLVRLSARWVSQVVWGGLWCAMASRELVVASRCLVTMPTCALGRADVLSSRNPQRDVPAVRGGVESDGLGRDQQVHQRSRRYPRVAGRKQVLAIELSRHRSCHGCAARRRLRQVRPPESEAGSRIRAQACSARPVRIERWIRGEV